LSKVTKICFVCLGNIVRSPLAEGSFKQLTADKGISKNFIVDSAGTSAYHVGESPDWRMRRVASRHGLSYDGRARQFHHDDFKKFDLIIAMDTNNMNNLIKMATSSSDREKIHLMREFDPYGGSGLSVPDPYYGGIDGFEEVFEIVQRSCEGLIDALENGKI